MKPITAIIPQRYSCRNYLDRPISSAHQQQISDYLAANEQGPLGARAHFKLVAATEENRQALKGLGTYGFIRGAMGFIIGAVGPGPKNMEDFGYLMERAILFATDLGLGTCWLGGSFTKSSFSREIPLGHREVIPAVTATGYAEDGGRAEDWVRQQAGSDNRYPWETLFFDQHFGVPLARANIGGYAQLLEMVRLGPSASNKQPWRVIRAGSAWHFYLSRTPNYGRGSLLFNVLRLADLQRVDLGIAMCHFELTARELGLPGNWVVQEPSIEKPDEHTEYTVSWLT